MKWRMEEWLEMKRLEVASLTLTMLAAQCPKGDGCAHCLHLTFANHFPKKARAQSFSLNRT